MSEVIDQVTKNLWDRAKSILLATISAADEKNQAERHLNSLIASVAHEDDTFVIVTTNDFAADLLRDKYVSKLKSSFTLAGATEDLKIDVRVDTSVLPPALTQPKVVKPVAKAVVRTNDFVSTMKLTPEYTFEEFVRGPSNSYVYAAAKGVVASPGKKGYNPMFIYGGTGLGKTHIMQAIGNALLKKDPGMSVCYLTTERFLNEYINALEKHQIQEFRDRYRRIDVLLVDDIQFLNARKNFQEEFFNTFNALSSEGKQIVMTSDVAPKDLPVVDERLISRFESGMVQEIEQPSYETRLAILKKKAESITPPINENILKFIAQNIKSHVRALEGALAKVGVYISTDPGITLNEDFLSHILKDFIEREQSRKKLTIEEVQTCVAKKYGVTIGQILSPERTASLVTPRQLSMWIARKFTTKSLPEIAAKFEKKHATVIHGIKTIEKRMEVEDDLKQTMEEVLSELGCTLSDKME